LAWAATPPEAFASVVLINTPPISNYRWHPLARAWRTPVLGELVHVLATRRRFAAAVYRDQLRPLPEAAIDRMWHDYDGGTAFAVLKLYRATHIRTETPAEELFRHLNRPALVVWGRRDPYIPARFAEEHRHAFPSATFVWLNDSGH